MKALRFLLVGFCLMTISATASAKHGLGTNNDIEMSETLPDMGLKSLVPGKLQVETELQNKRVIVEIEEAPTGKVSFRITRPNGAVVLEETRQVEEGDVVVLNRLRKNGKYTLTITDGHSQYKGTFVVTGK